MQVAEGSGSSFEPSPTCSGDEHFVRMLEPIMLVDMGSRHRNCHLARLADTLQVRGCLGLYLALLLSGGSCQALRHRVPLCQRCWLA